MRTQLPALGAIKQLQDNRNCEKLHLSPRVAVIKDRINPHSFPALIPGFYGVPGAWQTITDIITSALISLREPSVSKQFEKITVRKWAN